jgi:predicted  nucleic acid-binding Zn-ribbon protein
MSAKIQVGKYFAALERLKARGEPISNDAVALEAGSGRGSIKKSRPAYAELIAAIDSAAEQQAKAKVASDPVPGMRQDIDDLTRRLDQSLDREVALLHELYDLRAEVKQLAEENRLLKLGRLVPVQ